jgi:hypothetical protein
MYARLALNSSSSCLSLAGTGLAGFYHHASFPPFLDCILLRFNYEDLKLRVSLY